MVSLAELRRLEDHRVDVVLADGTRLTDCRLVSVGRLWARSVWLSLDDTDLIYRADEVTEIIPVDAGSEQAA